MKVYVDFKDLDAEDMPSNISNKYNLQIRSINGGSDYKNIKIQSLADYTKQVRKEVAEEIKKKVLEYFNVKNEEEYENSLSLLDALFTADVVFEILDKIGGEK